MKKCSICKSSKQLGEFHWKNRKAGVLSSVCKVCRGDITRDNYRRVKALCVKYLGGRCKVCDYSRCNAVFDFHHVDPTTKDFAVGSKHLSSFNKVKAELDKCVLLCANCHRETHMGLHPAYLIGRGAGSRTRTEL